MPFLSVELRLGSESSSSTSLAGAPDGFEHLVPDADVAPRAMTDRGRAIASI